MRIGAYEWTRAKGLVHYGPTRYITPTHVWATPDEVAAHNNAPLNEALFTAVYDALADHPYFCGESCCEFNARREVAFGYLVADVVRAAAGVL